MSRKLLQRTLDALDGQGFHWLDGLVEDIRAELEKPEPVEWGYLDVKEGYFYNKWSGKGFQDGKYRLLAEKISVRD